MAEKRAISEKLRDNPSFREDLRLLFDIPLPVLAKLRDRLCLTADVPIRSKDIDAAVNEAKIERRQLLRATFTLRYLAFAADESSISTADLVSEIEEVEGRRFGDQRPAIEKLFALTPAEKKDLQARQALSFGTTYSKSEFQPILVPTETDGLAAGALWSITYLDSENDERSFTFALSTNELRSLLGVMEDGLSKLEALEKRHANDNP